MNLAGFFFIADKQAKDFDITEFNLPKFSLLIPPNGTNSFFDLSDKMLNFCIPRHPFL